MLLYLSPRFTIICSANFQVSFSPVLQIPPSFVASLEIQAFAVFYRCR